MTDAAAPAILRRLAARGWTIAVAESLTGGLVASALIDVPGASASMRGGVVAYATDVKRDVLGVDGDLLASRGAVDPAVAQQMAEGARRLLDADVGVATTGVAGPEPQDGQPVGTVCISVVTPAGSTAVRTHVPGDRAEIRAAAVRKALATCLQEL
ncbi:CinA family protein [Microbacterium sp. NPDC055910]|uniref:CinA family protein n=1 Tax=Microbacterium sp. NPDC055910 TaxID=3345659 RepID=UPI0035D64DA6